MGLLVVHLWHLLILEVSLLQLQGIIQDNVSSECVKFFFKLQTLLIKGKSKHKKCYNSPKSWEQKARGTEPKPNKI
jgi:hypothetical protein